MSEVVAARSCTRQSNMGGTTARLTRRTTALACWNRRDALAPRGRLPFSGASSAGMHLALTGCAVARDAGRASTSRASTSLAAHTEDNRCQNGPYVYNTLKHNEGLGSQFTHNKPSLIYAAVLNATYIDKARGSPSAELPPSHLPFREEIVDIHSQMDFSRFLGLGSDTCDDITLDSHRAGRAIGPLGERADCREVGPHAQSCGGLTFVDALGVFAEHASCLSLDITEMIGCLGSKEVPTPGLNELCAALESERPLPLESDLIVSTAKEALGSLTPTAMSKLVIVFGFNTAHEDLGYCALNPEFRKRFRAHNGLEPRPRQLATVWPSQRIIGVHFRWGDVATDDVNQPSGKTVSLDLLAATANDVRARLGGQARVLFFSEGAQHRPTAPRG